MRYAEGLNPFVYSVSASLGYQYRKDGGNAGVVGLGVGLVLPVGLKAALGFTPAELRTVFGGSGDGIELLTRLLRFDYALGDRFVLSVEAPLVVNWRAARRALVIRRRVQLRALLAEASSRATPSSTTRTRRSGQDPEWVPPPAAYGRLHGRRTTVAVIAGISVTSTPRQRHPGDGAMASGCSAPS